MGIKRNHGIVAQPLDLRFLPRCPACGASRSMRRVPETKDVNSKNVDVFECTKCGHRIEQPTKFDPHDLH